ncbi:uncharacterized protein PV07_08449 [Cladophialophora immunda]|uniref:Uncharacterized protein n=1 Tax=Cladophialophora immunda TaxID=569365 RepID=A0A0D2C1T9_9EURO|nr:uncharacterized protein PV07_08449 [Cladophialophora immunda]KIW25258.1 hypothetical protein PV07_08449 [Cladophialophora immunda]
MARANTADNLASTILSKCRPSPRPSLRPSQREQRAVHSVNAAAGRITSGATTSPSG